MGVMFRRSLPEERGLLFVLQEAGRPSLTTTPLEVCYGAA